MVTPLSPTTGRTGGGAFPNRPARTAGRPSRGRVAAGGAVSRAIAHGHPEWRTAARHTWRTGDRTTPGGTRGWF
jgi:hypothetical protein